jgi:ubiquinone/menaquinone biosynthesis C-methylase UbiE
MKHWTQFWNTSKTLSSFSEGSAAGGYENDVKSFWLEAAKGLPKKAKVLDVGTGNGALAVLLQELSQANKMAFEVHAADLAEIDPVAIFKDEKAVLPLLEAIKFHPQTGMESLPFKDGELDMVVSQFAFEYADQKAALDEIMRVLKPGGKLVMLSHNKKSALVKDSTQGSAIIEHVLKGTPLFIQADLLLRIAKQFLEETDKETWLQSQHGQATIKTTKWIMEELRNQYSKDEQRVWVDDIVSRVARLMEGVRKEDAVARIRALNTEYSFLLAHQLRLQDQLQAAQTEGDVKKLITAAKKQGASGEYASFSTDGDVLGWTITLTKQD